MALSRKQILQFHHDGYLIVPGVVPSYMVRRALQTINNNLGTIGMPTELLPKFRSQSYCPEAQGHASLKDLMNTTQIVPIYEDLLGKDQVVPSGGAQIALRFPMEVDKDAGPPVGHLDGIGSGLNGSNVGDYSRNFAGLCVVLLNDLNEANNGNFTVWPESHRFFEGWFREKGTEVLRQGQPKVTLPQGPLQITGKAGDIVLTHHQLFHTAAPNAGHNIRYAAIFRINSKSTKEIGNEAYTDIWREWPGVRAALEPIPAATPPAPAPAPATATAKA